MESREVVIGSFWKHFKGNVYSVIALAKHTETGEDMVVYAPVGYTLEEKPLMWVRPLAMFLEEVTVNGEQKYRVERLS